MSEEAKPAPKAEKKDIFAIAKYLWATSSAGAWAIGALGFAISYFITSVGPAINSQPRLMNFVLAGVWAVVLMIAFIAMKKIFFKDE